MCLVDLWCDFDLLCLFEDVEEGSLVWDVGIFGFRIVDEDELVVFRDVFVGESVDFVECYGWEDFFY